MGGRRTDWKGQCDAGNLEYYVVRTATFVVAASDGAPEQKSQADWVCDGVDDDVELQAALDALPAGGGLIGLSAGTYALSNQLLRAIDNVTFAGFGRGSRLNLNGSTPIISAGSQVGWCVVRLDTDAGGVDTAGASECRLDYWKNGVRETEGMEVHAWGGAEHTGVPAYKRKAASQTVNNSTTMQNDTHLVFPVAANETWVVSYEIWVSAFDPAADLKIEIDLPSGAAMLARAELIDSTTGTIDDTDINASPGVAFALLAASGSAKWLRVKVIVRNGATPGNCQLEWAQQTAQATNLTFALDSWLEAYKL